MGFSLLAPLFLAGLLAVAVPILVHLTARDRRAVVRFPSLRFLTRLPYRQVRRQRLRHPFLFALRTLAVVLLVVAFARPFVRGAALGEEGDAAGREVVVALDRSYSMAYGDAWARAVRAAHHAVAAQPATARVSLLTFAGEARTVVGPTADRDAVARALDALAPGSGGTRLAPVLRLANEILAASPAGDRELILVSDFQARAWDRSDRTRLVAGATLEAVDVATADPANVTVADVVAAGADDGRPATVITARLVNRGPEAVRGLPVTVSVDGNDVARGRAEIPAAGSAALRLGPIPQPSGPARATVRIAGDALASDDAFHLTLSPRPAVPVLLVEAGDARGDAVLYLREALALAEEPAFEVAARPVDALSPADVAAAAVVVLHDSPFPAGAAGRALVDRVAAGGGLWVVAGSRSRPESWPAGAAALLPGRWRDTVDRLDVRGVSLASVDYSHPVFEIFASAGDGNVAGPRFYRYRPLVLDAAAGSDVAAIARYTDGAAALAERRYGEGRVLLWGSPLDNRWSNLPVQPVFVPFVHQVCRYLAGERASDLWREVGQGLNLREVLTEMDVEAPDAVTVETPSGSRREVRLDDAPVVPLEEAGFYLVELPGREAAPYPVAVNVERAESDLTRLDPEAFAAASTVPADPSSPPAVAASRSLSREERERRQGAWWYLMLAALVLLAVESWWSDRLA